MPNEYSSCLSIEGSPQRITKFLQKAAAPVAERFLGDEPTSDWYGPCWRVFYNLYPVPGRVMRLGWERAGSAWMSERWGHERFWTSSELRRESATRATFKFGGCYCPPKSWIAHVASTFPKLAFDHHYVMYGNEVGLARYRNGKWVAGWETLDPKPKQYPDVLDVYLRCGCYSEAVEDVTAILRTSKEPRLYLLRAQARRECAEEEDDSTATSRLVLADLNKAVKQGKQSVDGFLARAEYYAGRGQFGRARADFDAAVGADRHSPEALVARGYFCRERGDVQQALADAERAIRISPFHADAYYLRGLCREDVVDCKRAVADFTRLLKLDPGNSWGYYHRAAAWFKLKDYDRAFADFREARFWNRWLQYHGQWYSYVGTALQCLGRPEEAVGVFSEGIKELGRFSLEKSLVPELYLGRAINHTLLNRSSEADADFAKVEELDPEAYRSYVETLEAELARRKSGQHSSANI